MSHSTCIKCATPFQFQQGRGRPRTHCDECRRVDTRRRPRPRKPTRTCVRCGEEVEPRRTEDTCIKCATCVVCGAGGPDRGRYCAKCARARWAGAQRQAAAKWRARRRSQYVEDVSPAYIFNRDNWTCHLCLLPIPESSKWPDPQSASIDHVVPLSKGGDHSNANCRASHLACNLSKGPRGGNEQPLLFG